MTRQDEARSTMPVVDAIQVLVDNTADWIVVTNQSSARTWPKLARRLLDLHYNPSTMGGAGVAGTRLRARTAPATRTLCFGRWRIAHESRCAGDGGSLCSQ